MSFFEFPYTRTYSSDLGWLIRHVKWLTDQVENKTIKYADPIEWNITSQYELNTVVLDGTVAYLSKQAVPSGVSISNTDYWMPIFDIAPIVGDLANLRDQISAHYETSYTATRDYNAGDWMFINDGTDDLLYYALTNILTNGGLVPDVTIKKATVEDLVLACVAEIDRVDGDLTTLAGNVGDLANLTTTDKTSIVNAINEVHGDTVTNANDITTLSGNVGDLANLTTTDKTSIVNAINELDGDVGDLANLHTTDKTSIVNAINETLDTAGKIIYMPSDTLGLDSTGATDCASILSGLTDNVGFKAGTYAIKSNCTINCDMLFAHDAKLAIDPGVTVTINGCLIAERRQIFSGDVSGLTVDASANPVGYPEWFGAIADNSTDCTTAINNCLSIFSVTQLTIGKYVVNDKLTVASDKVLVGYKDVLEYSGENPNYKGSVIIAGGTFASDRVIDIESTIGATVKELVLDGGSEARVGITGIWFEDTIRTKISDVFIRNFQTCVYATENITSYLYKVSGYIESDLSIYCFGVHLDGQTRGMSSLYIDDCAWGFGGTATIIGLLGSGQLNDLYINKFETARGSVGIQLNPSGDSVVKNGDIWIRNCVLDGSSDTALRIQGTNPTYNRCNIHVTNLWVGYVETGASKTAVDLNNVQNVMIDGAEIYSNAHGIRVQSSNHIFIDHVSLVSANVQNGAYGVYYTNCHYLKAMNMYIYNFYYAIVADAATDYLEASGSGYCSTGGVILGGGLESYWYGATDAVSATYKSIVRAPYHFYTS